MAVLNDLFVSLETGSRVSNASLCAFLVKLETTLRSLPWQTDVAETSSLDPSIICRLLEIFYNEKIPDSSKCYLLSLIEEHATVFSITRNSTSQLVQSLLDVFRTCRTVQKSPRFAGFLLQTIASLLVQFDLVLMEGNTEINVSFVVTLLEIVYNRSSASRDLRYRAILSLKLLEQHYPTLLYSKLDQLLSLLKTERSVLFECLLGLFLTTLKNAVHLIATRGQEKCPQLFEKQSDRFISFALSRDILLEKIQFLLGEKPYKLHPVVCNDLSTVLRFCVDQSDQYLSTLGQAQVVRDMSCILYYALDESPSLFKTLVYRYTNTSNTALMEVLLALKARFGEELFGVLHGSNDELLESLVDHVIATKLSIPHRLLAGHWVLHYPTSCIPRELDCPMFPYRWSDSLKLEKPDPCISFLMADHMTNLLPSNFDPLDLKYVKLFILSHCVHPECLSDQFGQLLIGALNGIRKQVQYRGVGRSSALLLKAMYSIHMRFPGTPLSKEIVSLLMGLTYEHISLTKSTLYYLKAADNALSYKTNLNPPIAEAVDFSVLAPTTESLTIDKSPNSGIACLEPVQNIGLTRRCLAELTDFVCDHVALAIDEPTSVLPHYMNILELAAQMEPSKTKVILDVLLRVVRETEVCEKGDWLKGHLILDICKALMTHQETGQYFEEMCQILEHIHEHFAEPDVVDRTGMLLTMLTKLSSDRVSEVFRSKVDIKPNEKLSSASNFEGFPGIKSVETLDYPVLTLTKLHVENRTMRKPPQIFDTENTSEEALLTAYDTFLEEIIFSVNIMLSGLRTEAGINLGVLYFPELSWRPLIDDVTAELWTTTSLDTDISDDHPLVIDLELENIEPSTFKVIPTLEFTLSTGSICQSQLSSIQMSIEDLCLPLPVASHLIKSLTPLLHTRKKYESFTVIHFTELSHSKFARFIQVFQVEANSDTNTSEFILFFPPCFHVWLLMTQVRTGSLIFRMDSATDLSSDILVEFEAFLKQFNDSTSQIKIL